MKCPECKNVIPLSKAVNKFVCPHCKTRLSSNSVLLGLLAVTFYGVIYLEVIGNLFYSDHKIVWVSSMLLGAVATYYVAVKFIKIRIEDNNSEK
jgi:hypothetical protein